MTICLVCQSKHRAAVDDALMAGASVRATASRFDLSKSGVGRHRAGCLQPKLAAAARITAPAAEVRADVERARAIVSGTAAANHADILSLTALLGRLARSLDRLEGSADATAGQGLHTSLAADGGARFTVVINVPSEGSMRPGLRDATSSRLAGQESRAPCMTLRFGGQAGEHPIPHTKRALTELPITCRSIQS